jgi:hypothetical protein
MTDETSKKILELEERLSEVETRLSKPIYPYDKCPNCGFNDVTAGLHQENRIVNSTGQAILREYKCNSCGKTWKVQMSFE